MSNKNILFILIGIIILLGGYAAAVRMGYIDGPAFVSGTAAQPSLEGEVVFPSTVPAEAIPLYQEKIDQARANLKADPDLFNEWINLGGIYEAIGNYEDARDVYEYASQIRPANAISFTNVGNLYSFHLKEYRLAERNFKQAIENDASYEHAYRGLIELYTVANPDAGKAEDVLKDAIERFKQIDMYVTLARFYRTEGRTEEAKATYDEAIAAADKAANLQVSAALKAEKEELN